MKQVLLNGFLFLDVPEGAKDVTVFSAPVTRAPTVEYFKGMRCWFELPPGSYSIVGMAKDLNLVQQMDLCDKFHNGAWRDYELSKYFDPADDMLPFCLGVEESFLSLLKSHSLELSTTLIIKKIL